jgi:hypothetical protein
VKGGFFKALQPRQTTLDADNPTSQLDCNWLLIGVHPWRIKKATDEQG